MADILLLTELELTKGSPLGGNIDIDKYRYIINETQVFVLENILGTKLFNKIKTDFDAETITGVYNTILQNYLKPILIYSVVAEYCTVAGFEVLNSGIMRRTPENMTPATKEEMDYMANKQRGKADVYIERLERYLCDQQANIPEYTYNQDNTFDIDPDKDTRTFGGWRLGGGYYTGTNAEIEIYRDILREHGKA